MNRFLLDSGIASDYINRRNGIRDRAHAEVAKGNRIGIGVTGLAELIYGIELSSSRAQNMDLLRRALPSLTVWLLTEEAVAIYGTIAAQLRRVGRPMQVFDMLVASIALNLANVSNDSDLWAIPGLPVENWAKG